MTADRRNEGKSRVDLIDPGFILGVGDVLHMGAEKYSQDNWMQSCNTEEHDNFRNGCRASMLRHIMAYTTGEENDPESGLHHMYHVACNAMFIDFYDRNKKF